MVLSAVMQINIFNKLSSLKSRKNEGCRVSYLLLLQYILQHFSNFQESMQLLYMEEI